MTDTTKNPATSADDNMVSALEQLAAELAADPFWEAQRNPEPFDGTNAWISGRPPVKAKVQPPGDGAMK
jgi:hypothetical protein